MTAQSTHRLLRLTPLMLALAVMAVAADEAPAPPTTAPAPVTDAGVPTAIRAEALFNEAQAAWRDARFAEASDRISAAIRLAPGEARYVALQRDIQGVLAHRGDRLEMAAEWYRIQRDVRTQELAVRIASLVREGDTAMTAGDYHAAELAFDRAEVALRSFPYAFEWGDLPAQIVGKRTEARARASQQEAERGSEARAQAITRANEEQALRSRALDAKVDELLRRAREAYGRKDYERAELEAWNAYELDRRREDARNLYLDARRARHERFDDDHADALGERMARINEEVHRSLIPQSEILIYPEDWQRRNRRKSQELGASREEAWVQALKDRLEQRITVDFVDQPFEDVISYLRQVTGVNIIVAPEVIASNGGGTVQFRAKDMRFGDALKWVLQLSNLHMALQNQAIFISKTQISGAVVLKLYDVADLISAKRDMPGKELAFSSGGDAGAGNLFTDAPADQKKPPSADEIVEFIRKNVPQGDWDKNTSVGIEQRAGSTLFVTQTPEVHRLIEQLLTNLRNQDSLQVKVDIRILSIRKNYFEEIGVDWSGQGGLLQNSSGLGYARQNENTLIGGSVTNNGALPANNTSNAFTQSTPSGGNKGLTLNVAQSPFNFLNTSQVNLILTAVENESDIRVLQRPTITCFNGMRANASFMNQLAYIKTYDIVSQNLDPKIEVLAYGDVIDVRPVVSSDRKYVMMEVKPSTVDLAGIFTETVQAFRILSTGGGGTGGGTTTVFGPFRYPIQLPNVQVRSLRSTIMLPDRSNILLGGFEQSLRQRTEVGIPFLSHIPFLGRLFSRTGSYDENSKLFYLMHVEILNLSEQEAAQ